MSKRRSSSKSRDPDYEPPNRRSPLLPPPPIPPPMTPPPRVQPQPAVRTTTTTTTTTTTPALVVRGEGNFAASPATTLGRPNAQYLPPGTLTWALVTPVGAPQLFEPFADYMARVKKTPTRKNFFV